jgi:argininosuccinate lyase
MLAAARFAPPPPSPVVSALDLAERLVGRGVPFREAHRAVGVLVAKTIEDGKDWSALTAADLEAVDSRFLPVDVGALDAEGMVRQRVSPGGGSLESVRDQIRAVRARIERAI